MANPRIFLSPPQISEREYDLVREALDSNYVAPLGPMVDRFEAALARYTGFPHALALSSGTAALHLALRVLGVEAGDRVVVPSLTFIGSVVPVLYQGAEPIFVDSSAKDWLIDADMLDATLARLAREGRPAKAVIVVDLYGQPCDGALYAAICDRHGAALVVDAAESLGSTLRGRHAGHGAQITCLSFNGNKIITTSGGGALLSDDEALVRRARNLSQQARVPVAHYEHVEFGYNYRLSNILGAIGLAQLETIEDRVARRRALFDAYRDRLGGLPGLSFIPDIPEARCNRWLSVALFDKNVQAGPEEVRLALEAVNIEARAVWKPMHMQPLFRDAEMVGGRVAEDLFARGLCLPSGAQVDDDVLDRICAIVDRLVEAPEAVSP
ncbi:aminotransferase class I/II-fold pyridoxal phosphate-dependent enzyme [Chelatococcus sp. SYSU_G07232]|uniref:Aminotransferase class I/II-fold pyridoxal phosphate-dependent enzyme n=1 Tax=Chelatococcus albus TaxID=3047466 RepID=A0ABT7AH74_9HYPH|nr:aminotransferase class I/II-fold pyridoxal phosphate-dependent enzyme [Chelatococcus sp. SYSU_G07232]MDJ1158184.1 aminotransferase class I/II-fold pyridoxal phosphate-dependent enzyme [Chelatococcus sp. SYSU_G07232]